MAPPGGAAKPPQQQHAHNKQHHQPQQDEEPSLTFYQKASVWANQFYQGIQITLPYALSVFIVRYHRQGGGGFSMRLRQGQPH